MTAIHRLAAVGVLSVAAWFLTAVGAGDGERIALDEPHSSAKSDPALDSNGSPTPAAGPAATAQTTPSPTMSSTAAITPTAYPASTVEPTPRVAATTSPRPPAPSGLEASVAGDTVVLRWNPVAGARYYNIYRSDDGLAFEGVGSSGKPSFVDANLRPGGRFRYIVTAVHPQAGQSGDSAPASVTIPTVSPTPTPASAPE